MFICYLDKKQLVKIGAAILFLAVFFILLTVLIPQRDKEVNQVNWPLLLEQVPTGEKALALTVNVDWGEEYIPVMLDALDKYNAKVTFFVTGRWADKNPDLLKVMAARGHEIENHGYSHPHPDQLTVAQNKEEILKTEKVIFEITGKKTRLYAPPYGERGRNGLRAAEELGYTTILWTLDTIDWRADSTPEIIAQRILNPKIRNRVKPERKGAIVLMHPKENTARALPGILSRLEQDGYQSVTLEKLITSNLSGNTTP